MFSWGGWRLENLSAMTAGDQLEMSDQRIYETTTLENDERTRGSVQTHKGCLALDCLGIARDFFGSLAIVLQDSHAYPPISYGTAKAQNFGGFVFPG